MLLLLITKIRIGLKSAWWLEMLWKLLTRMKMVSRADEPYMSSNFYCTYTNIDAILVLLVVGGVRGVVGGCGQGVCWEGG